MKRTDRLAANESRRDGFAGVALILLAAALALWHAWPGELPDTTDQLPPHVYAAGR